MAPVWIRPCVIDTNSYISRLPTDLIGIIVAFLPVGICARTYEEYDVIRSFWGDNETKCPLRDIEADCDYLYYFYLVNVQQEEDWIDLDEAEEMLCALDVNKQLYRECMHRFLTGVDKKC